MWVFQNYLSGSYSEDQFIAYWADVSRRNSKIALSRMVEILTSANGKSTPAINEKVAKVIERYNELEKNPEALTQLIKTSHPRSKIDTIKAQGMFPFGVNVPLEILSHIFTFLKRDDLDNFCRTCSRFYTLKAPLLALDQSMLEPFLSAHLDDYDVPLFSFLGKCPEERYKTQVTVPYLQGMWEEAKPVYEAVANKFPLSVSLNIFMERFAETKLEYQELIATCPRLKRVQVNELNGVEDAAALAGLLASCSEIEELHFTCAHFDALQAFIRAMTKKETLGTIDVYCAQEFHVPIQRKVEAVFELCALFPQVHSVIFDVCREPEVVDLSGIALPTTLQLLHLKGCCLSAGDLKKLAISCPKFKELALSGITTLPEHFLLTDLPANLETLRLEHAHIPHLDKFVSNLPKLSRFIADELDPLVIERGLPPGLRCLSVINSHLRIDGLKMIISQSELEELTLSYLSLNQLEYGKYAEVIKKDLLLPHVKSLDISYNRAVPFLEKLISCCPNLQKLDLRSTRLDICCISLPRSIQDINLAGVCTQLSPDDLVLLFQKLPNLTHINLCSTTFISRNGPLFTTIPTSVVSIDLSNTNVSEDDVNTIFTRCHGLKKISLPKEISAETIAKMNLPQTLEEIRGIKIEWEAFKLQCPVLRVNSYSSSG